MDYDEDKVGLKLNALELAVVDLVVDGHLVEQYMGSRERHKEGGRPRCG